MEVFKKHRTDLEKLIESNDINGILLLMSDLFNAEVTQDVLKETRIAIVIQSKLLKHSNEEVVKASKELVAKWKTKLGSPSTTNVGSPSTNTLKNSSQKSLQRTSTSNLKSPSATSGQKPLSKSASGLSVASSPGDLRSKVKDLFAKALILGQEEISKKNPDVANASDPSMEKTRITSLAEDIETALFNKYGEAGGELLNSKYKTHVRSLKFNLEANKDLQEMILVGYYSPEELCNLSKEDLANKEAKERIKAAREYYEQAVQLMKTTPPVTDEFRCNKCGQRKCTFFQMQTRSADEPMTTFISCTVCGKKWRM